MNTLEMCNDEDYKNLETLADVEERMIKHLNSTHTLVIPLDFRDRSFLGRSITVLQAYLITNEINKSIANLSLLLADLNGDQGPSVKHMRDFIESHARFSNYWAKGRLNYDAE